MVPSPSNPFGAWSRGAVIVTVATLVALPSHPAAARPADDGRGLLDKGQYEDAAKWFLAAVAKTPEDAAARAGAAEALLGLGRNDEAIEQAEAGLDLEGHGNDAGLWYLLARAYMRRGDSLPAGDEEIPACYSDAAAKAGQALRHDAKLHAARAVLARSLRMLDDIPQATKVMTEALEKAPQDFDIQFEAGELHLTRTKNYDAALHHYRKAAEIDPASAVSRLREGLVLCYLRQWDKACDAFVAAAKLDLNDTQALAYIAKYGPYTTLKAAALYGAILKEKPSHAWAHAYLGWVQAAAGEEAAAMKAGQNALSLAKDVPHMHAWYGDILYTLKKDSKAWAGHYKKALEMSPAVDLAWNRLLEHASNPTNATPIEERLEWIDFLTRVRPDDPWIWNNLGLIHRDMTKNYRKSLDAYIKASELKYDDQGIVNDTGLMYQFHGKSLNEDPSKALPYYQRVIILVEEEMQNPEMGYRDTLENLALYYGPKGGEAAHKEDPELALRYARMRNDPDLLSRLSKDIAQRSGRAAAVESWALKQLGK